MIDPDDPILNGTLWKYIGGVYWNTTHTDLDVTVVLDENDQSLASGINRGSIQLKVSSDPDLNTPVDQYLNLSIEEDILPASVAAGSRLLPSQAVMWKVLLDLLMVLKYVLQH